MSIVAYLKATVVVCGLCITHAAAQNASTAVTGEDILQFVDPLIGTVNGGL